MPSEQAVLNIQLLLFEARKLGLEPISVKESAVGGMGAIFQQNTKWIVVEC